MPLLTPEFSNPLFLKLFCSGLKNRGLTRVPTGLEGISAIFAFFLESVQERLADPLRLDFDAHVDVVHRGVAVLAEEMLATSTQWVPRERAATLLNQVLPDRGGFDRSLLKGLIAEGVLGEELVWTGYGDERQDVVRFTYERMADHRIARLLLDRFFANGHEATVIGEEVGTAASGETDAPNGAVTEPSTDAVSQAADTAEAHHDAVGPTNPLSLTTLLRDEQAQWYYQGVITALSIQLPERTGRELWEQWPTIRNSPAIADAFFDGLLWRRPDAIGPTAIEIVLRNVRSREGIGDRVRDLLVSTATRPKHPLNSTVLDTVLRSESMPDRDVWWSTYVAQQDDLDTPIGRLIDWAWRAGRETHHADESVALASKLLAWSLTTSNRSVRDRATKALVSLLHGRTEILLQLLRQFSGINDPYVAERVYAVAYGCALRGLSESDLEQLAREVFTLTFASAHPRPQLLLRDYARGIVETAAASGLIKDLDLRLIRPPYRSDPPEAAPTEDELRERFYTPYQRGKQDGYFSIWFSLLSAGDFARYVVGTNNQSFPWTSRPLSEASATPFRRYRAFLDSLSDAQRKSLNSLQSEKARLELLIGSSIPLSTGTDVKITKELLETWTKEKQKQFRKRLTKTKRAEFDVVRDWSDAPVRPYPFDLEYALRWLFQRVIDLGWTPQRFNWFDREVGYEGRTSHKVERIGKKYQWIAFDEFTARVADNFELADDLWSNKPRNYHGPWQFWHRDIDPSYLGRGRPPFDSDRDNAWWQPVRHTDWHREKRDEDWITTAEDLPALRDLVQVRDPQDGSSWLRLRGDVEWREIQLPEQDRYEYPQRSILYWITGFIVRSSDYVQMLEWALESDLSSMRIHDSVSTTQVFMGEYPWAPSFSTQYGSMLADPWVSLDARLPVSVLQPDVTLYWESGGYDRSIESTVSISAPAPALLGRDIGVWRRRRGHAEFRNPALIQRGPNALLARASSFHEGLRSRKWKVVWLLTGEKLVIGGDLGSDYWPGRLDISGVGVITKSGWRERITTHAQGPVTRAKR